MLRYALLAATLASPSLATAAVSTIADQIRACSAEAADDKRLVCYDGIAKQTLMPPPKPDPTPQALDRQSGSTQAEIKDGDMFGRWHAEVTVDAMNDKRTVGFRNVGLPDQSRDARDARIGLLCSGKSIRFLWMSRAYLGKSELPLNNVSYRVDVAKSQSEKWDMVKNIATPADAVSIVHAMANAKRLVIEVRSYDYETHQAVFDIDGITDVLGQLSECWPPPPPSPPVPAPASASLGVRPAPAPTPSAKQNAR